MDHLVWDIDPTIIRWGPIQIRYYGILFALTILIGFHFIKSILLRMNYPEERIYPAFYWIALGGVLGARIGHCLFYEPLRYLHNPLEILYIWKGGLASHGGTAGILAGTILFAIRNRIPIRVVLDTTTFGSAVAATFVRLGNFFNSEIVGRPTDLPWAIHFPRSSVGGSLARHPSQLYEAALGAFIFVVMILIDRMLGNRRPRLLLTGTFLVIYFLGRFLIEFVKEYQALGTDSVLTMGQYLSIPWFFLGWVFLYFAWRERGRITGEIPPETCPDPDKKI